MGRRNPIGLPLRTWSGSRLRTEAGLGGVSSTAVGYRLDAVEATGRDIASRDGEEEISAVTEAGAEFAVGADLEQQSPVIGCYVTGGDPMLDRLLMKLKPTVDFGPSFIETKSGSICPPGEGVTPRQSGDERRVTTLLLFVRSRSPAQPGTTNNVTVVPTAGANFRLRDSTDVTMKPTVNRSSLPPPVQFSCVVRAPWRTVQDGAALGAPTPNRLTTSSTCW
jgi:hypothetical protein